MGLKQPRGLVLPKVRKPKKLPRILSQRSIARLIQCCGLYDKTLLALTYDCALRVSEVCRLRWEDICFDRRMLFVCQSKGMKDRYVPISSQMLIVLKAFRKKYPSDDFVFKTHGRGVTPQRITPEYVRTILKNALAKASLDQTITIHDRIFKAAWATLKVTDNEISYDYKDYRKGGKHGVMTMDIDGFLNLLSQHILPDRFVRIRHYGILSPACREILRCIQQQLNVPPVPKERKKKSYLDICNEKGWEIGVCKDCNCRRIIVSIINPAPRAPPFRIWHIAK